MPPLMRLACFPQGTVHVSDPLVSVLFIWGVDYDTPLLFCVLCSTLLFYPLNVFSCFLLCILSNFLLTNKICIWYNKFSQEIASLVLLILKVVKPVLLTALKLLRQVSQAMEVLMTYLVVENHLYLSGKPFALAYNLGDLGYIVRFILSSGFLSDPVHYSSFTDFCHSVPYLRSRISLGGPFPSPFNPSPSDVK